MDQSEVGCLINWPFPDSLKALRGFLGLSGYYRRFIKHYGILARPLTSLLKKATAAFEQLKKALCLALMSVLPNFQLEFYIDADASDFGVGAILQQGRLMAYFSRGLEVRHQALSIYEKEMLVVLLVVKSGTFI
ncbi:peroxidase 64 [Gossypium australe]|uniref:Peroxidase 64 n=1 Tax=Gossypium australe TaxID=47621 RepID=A0A5B6VKP7_9ROSI|nr:peroxidase 64 [Gossypium australe]